MDSAFFFSMELIVILYHINNAHEACASERSDSEKCHTSLCITLMVTFLGNWMPLTACLRASKLEDQSDLSISLSSASLLSDLSPDMNCCIADSGVCFLIWSAISIILFCASFSFFTTSMIRPGSGRSVIPSICTGSHQVAFSIFWPFRFCILLILP